MLHDFEVGDLVVWNSRDKNARRKIITFPFYRKTYGPGPFRVTAVRHLEGRLLLTARQAVTVKINGQKETFLGLAFRPASKKKPKRNCD